MPEIDASWNRVAYYRVRMSNVPSEHSELNANGIHSARLFQPKIRIATYSFSTQIANPLFIYESIRINAIFMMSSVKLEF